MKNVADLRQMLSEVSEELRSKKINVETARALIGISNSIVKSSLAELASNKFMQNKVQIPFLKTKEDE